MSDQKNFSTKAAMSIVTGRLLSGFDELHELAEWLVGHPIWTHEFASQELADRLKQLVLLQQPTLDHETEIYSDVTPDEAIDFGGVYVERFGATLVFRRGGDSRTVDPVTSLVRVMAKGEHDVDAD